MTQTEVVNNDRLAPAEPNRENTIKQVLEWCQAREITALQKPGREVTLVIERYYWGEPDISCPGLNLRSPHAGEAIRQYINAVTRGKYSHSDLLELLDNQSPIPEGDVMVRKVMVDTHTSQLQVGIREHLDPDGELLSLEYFLESPRPRLNLLNFLRRKRGASSTVPLSMTGSFW